MLEFKKQFPTASEFSLHIEQLALKNKTTCVQALIDYCEDHDLESEVVAKMVNKSLREKIAVEFSDLGMLPRAAGLYD